MTTETVHVDVEPLANVHSHLRELDVAPRFMELAIEGGVDVILPMPNLKKPLLTADLVGAYISVLMARGRQVGKVVLISTAYLTETTTVEEIIRCVTLKIYDFKIYPRNRTTQSAEGARRYFRIIETVREASRRILEMFGIRIKVHVHPEHPSMVYGSRDAEFAFLPIVYMLLSETDAIIIWEHGTDSECIPHWREFAKSGRFYVTLTAHHLLSDEDESFGDVRSTCKPPLKRALDRECLIDLVCEGNSWVMAGGDDAPHPASAKHVEKDRCACGAYTAPRLLAFYAQALGRLLVDNDAKKRAIFIGFTSRNARALHGLGQTFGYVTLARERDQVPMRYDVNGVSYESFWAGRFIDWRIISRH